MTISGEGIESRIQDSLTDRVFSSFRAGGTINDWVFEALLIILFIIASCRARIYSLKFKIINIKFFLRFFDVTYLNNVFLQVIENISVT